MTKTSYAPVSTTLTSFEIIENIHKNNGGTISEIANEVGLAKSTAHRHLRTLKDAGWIVEEEGTYHLGLRFLQLGKRAQRRNTAYNLIKEKVEQIAEETGERSQFIIEENGYGLYLYTALGENAVRTDSGEGKRMLLNSISAGKAILAEMDEERVRQIIDARGLPRSTPNTITDEESLFDELKQIRELGYAINEGESTEGLRAVSVPVKGPEEEVLGAIGVSGPSHRLNYEEIETNVIDLLLGVVNEIELDIQYN